MVRIAGEPSRPGLRAVLAAAAAMVAGSACGEDGGGRAPTYCETQARQDCAGDEDPASCAAEQVPRCVNARYFGGYEPTPVSACAGDPGPQAIDGAKQVHLFRHSSTPEDDAIAETRSLQRYYEEYSLEFYSALDALPTVLPHLMEGDQADFTEAIIEAGVPITGGELTPEQQEAANAAIARVMFKPFRRFMNAHGGVGPGMNVTVIPIIVADELVPLMGEGAASIAGLGVSPALLAAEEQDDPSIELAKLLGLPRDFKPSIFVGHQVMLEYSPEYYDYIIAHELGHGLGLQHTYSQGNVMRQGGYDCRPYLEPWQIASMVGLEPQRAMRSEVPAASPEGLEVLPASQEQADSAAVHAQGQARTSTSLAAFVRGAIASVREHIRQPR